MSVAPVARATPDAGRDADASPLQLALLGTGTVGSAVLARLRQWQGTPVGAGLRLVHVANRRNAWSDRRGLCALRVQALRNGPRSSAAATTCDEALAAFSPALPRLVIDATADAAISARHADWLAQGIHVVTACKLGQGGDLAQWRDIQGAARHAGSFYGDSATVGAGLPLLRSIRALRAGGDRIHAIAGVLSGSLAWLFDRYDGMRPFSGFVRQARDAGYTEPDPREDLSGEDVRRKLLILARAAGCELERDAVRVESLVPRALAGLHPDAVDAALPLLDAPLRQRHAQAWKSGRRLRCIARWEAAGARVGLEALEAGDPLCGGRGTDNRVAIWSDRYATQPLLVQGPGAGAEVTAAALLDDVLRIRAQAATAKNASIGCGFEYTWPCA